MKVCLIEFYRWHSECLYAQVQFLQKSGAEVTMVCDVRQRSATAFARRPVEVRYYPFDRLRSLLLLAWFIRKHRFDAVILNTAQGSLAWKFLLLPLPKRTPVYGILHNLRKLSSGTSQRIISRRVKHYFLLAPYLLHRTPKTSVLRFEAVSTAFFPPYRPLSIPKKTSEKYVCIPGGIEKKRRDYDGLLALARRSDFPDGIRFILLGNAAAGEGPAFIRSIRQAGAAGRFVWFDRFVPYDTFMAWIQASDLLLPLIHDHYYDDRISGAFTLSDVFGKTMIVHELFARISGFDYPAYFYRDAEELLRLLRQPLRPLPARPVDFEENRKKYMDFITSGK